MGMSDFGSKQYFKNNLGVDVHYKIWEGDELKGQVVFCHGDGEHFMRYSDVFQRFAEEGIKVLAFDQMGCGETGAKANNLGRPLGIEQVMQDMTMAIDMIHDAEIPLYLVGHSFGGLAVLTYLCEGKRRQRVHGAIASTPIVEFAQEVMPNFPVYAGLVGASYAMPWYKVRIAPDEGVLSHDAAAVEAYKADPLNTFTTTLIQLREMLYYSQRLLFNGFAEISCNNLLIAHGTADTISSYDATLSLATKISSLGQVNSFEMKPYEGLYHDLMFEEDAEEVISNYLEWIQAHIPNK